MASRVIRFFSSMPSNQRTNSVRSKGVGDGGDMSSPAKIVVPPSNERNFVLGGMPKRPPPSDKYRKKLNVFNTGSL